MHLYSAGWVHFWKVKGAGGAPVDNFRGAMPISSSLFGMLRRALGIGSLAIVVVALSACATEPDPELAWTEEEAYAAAEQTFRAYWALGFDDSDTEPTRYLTGEMLAHYDDTASSDNPDEIEFKGEAAVTTFEPSDFASVGNAVSLSAVSCIDASTLQVKDPSGAWVEPRDETHYAVSMTFASAHGELLIDSLTETQDDECGS